LRPLGAGKAPPSGGVVWGLSADAATQIQHNPIEIKHRRKEVVRREALRTDLDRSLVDVEAVVEASAPEETPRIEMSVDWS
jgi:hypothetical protein